MVAFNLHNYYIGELTETDEDANQFWMRFAMPFTLGGDWLMRASLPINSYPTPPDASTETGLGDLNVFAADTTVTIGKSCLTYYGDLDCSKAAIGTYVKYALTITNDGAATATSVHVEDDYPENYLPGNFFIKIKQR